MGIRRITLTVLGAATLVPVVGGAFGSSTQESFPPGPGKEVFESVCSLCHSPVAVVNKRWTEKQWDAKVTEMLQEEQDVTTEERAAIVAYLSANFKPLTKVAVNRAAATELAKTLGLSEKEAEAIVRDRQEKGPFKDLADLKRVSGIDATRLETVKDQLEF